MSHMSHKSSPSAPRDLQACTLWRSGPHLASQRRGPASIDGVCFAFSRLHRSGTGSNSTGGRLESLQR
ncbi:unnamed protein product [Lota lota]